MQTTQIPKEGVFAVYKPKGVSSNGFLNKIRKLAGTRRVGHAGTLDPLASGVLLVGMGTGTKELAKLVGAEKEYLAVIRLGEGSTTDDAEGAKTAVLPKKIPVEDEVRTALLKFIGDIKQETPAYSAVKMGGVPAYRRARRGERLNLGLRSVTISKLELVSYRWPELEVRATVSSGTYIRALARDIGKTLGTAGYLLELERTRVDGYRLSDCLRLEL